MRTVSIIGVGRLGSAFALALSRSDHLIDRLIYRSTVPLPEFVNKIAPLPAVDRFDRIEELDTDLILLTVPDDTLIEVAHLIAPGIKEGAALLHTSGALSSQVLKSAADRGVATGSIHPLVSVSDAELGSHSLRGSFFCIEGDPRAVELAEEIVIALNGKSFSIETALKPLYHSAAVLGSGHHVALFSTAVKTLGACGVEPFQARQILLPLLQSTLANLVQQDAAEALTGPFARLDADAVERHLEAFKAAALPDSASIYLELGLEALRLAEKGMGSPEKIEHIRQMIKFARSASE